ncbi:MAG: T9SS type A sorting domain-containing protein [Chitinophagales bacterium]
MYSLLPTILVLLSTPLLKVNLLVYNLGKAINDSIDIELTRIFPNGNQEVITKKFPAPYHKDTFSINLAVNGSSSGLGLNNFNIFIDASNEINNELSETNNYLLNNLSLFIGSDDIYPIYPYEFAIVPNPSTTLKASTGNPFEVEKRYVFQIDTSELFLAPLAEYKVFSTGGVVEWPNPINMVDSTVYYWRVSVDSSSNSTYKWNYSSFIYLNGEFPGWNQSHYYQWQKDKFETIYLDTDREFKFIDVPREVYVKTGLYPNLFYEEMEWKLDGAQMHNWKMNNCGGGVGFPNGLSIAVINNITGTPLYLTNNSSTSSYGPYGNIHCSGIENVITVANFRASGNTPTNHPTPGIPWSNLILDYLNNVPSDHYVLIYSINNPNYSSWSPNLVAYLNNLACPVNNNTDGPMIFVYQKNNTSFNPIVNIGASFNDIITNTFSINGIWSSGNFKSTLIGPASAWGSFHWDFEAKENPSQDVQSVNIIGVDNAGVENTLYTVSSASLDTSLQGINAQVYPYLRLQWNSSDDLDRTPMQAKYWRVLYDKAPEVAINPKKHFSVNKDSLMQGEVWHFEVALENVSEIDMDSMTVKQSIIDNGNNANISYAKYDSAFAFDTLHLSYALNTISANYLGKNTLILEANPFEQNYQIEQFHFNNFATYSFFVEGDNTNPLLDVSFDGRKILDGDLVSAKPEILIQLKDENQFLALDDTSLIDIYFRYLGTDGSTPGSLWRVNYNDVGTQFIPAESNKNIAKVIVKEEFPLDGLYELVVRSKDKSGNNSSSTQDRLIDLQYYDYKISFQVENRSMISNVLNYPNPFTTRTQFIFTLTGSEIPDYFEIVIMNIKGTVVKQIRQDEIGPIHIGLNKTDYWWDGKDQYGDPLANGVYFYQVKTSINNESIDRYDIQQVDRFFKKGLGKMVLIR